MGTEAPPDEVRAAYRMQVRALHPDVRDPTVPAVEAEAALRLLNEAWEVLGDPHRRASYDEGREAAAPGADAEAWAHGTGRFPWWIVVLAVLLVIFVFTAYAGGPAPAPSPR